MSAPVADRTRCGPQDTAQRTKCGAGAPAREMHAAPGVSVRKQRGEAESPGGGKRDRDKHLREPLSSYSGDVITDSTTLYRPVGQKEFDLVRASGFREFPPRLPEQPFFYPVLNEDYATQIAHEWNTKDEHSGFAGYVLRFNVQAEFVAQYEIHVVGNATHREYWIPAAELASLNANIVGSIEVVSEFHGKK
jgi:hypothetical protein